MRWRALSLALMALGFSTPLAAAHGDCIGVIASAAGSDESQSFSATRVIDVPLRVLFSPSMANKLTGDHVLEVRILTPRSHLYQSISVPITLDRGKRGQQKKVPGYPRPIGVQILTETTFHHARAFETGVALPVAGTPVINSSLYGEWAAEAFLDGAAETCGSRAVFAIKE